MAKPRVFISSTFYDLKQVRTDLDRFIIRELGYDPVRHETGNIPYEQRKALEQSCYKEISQCDIVLSIIGSRLGSESYDSVHSISQMELKVALENNKSVYIFVNHEVLADLKTYRANDERADIRYGSVDDARILSFIYEVQNLPTNNALFPFDTANEITSILKEQWAGLFRNMLDEKRKADEINVLRRFEKSLATTDQMLKYIAKERSDRDETIKSILTQNNPIFSRLAEVTHAPYRVFFINKEEMATWLKARGWQDDSIFDEGLCWTSDSHSSFEERKITINEKIFDEDGKLNQFDTNNWIELEEIEKSRPSTYDDLDDEIPF
ncbi:MAG: DUF4062 domain-containing protein [Geminicoccaceae bacterium]